MDSIEAAHYREHILDVVDDNQRHMPQIIEEIVEKGEAECVDDNCEHGAVELAGSLWQILITQWTDKLGGSLKKAGVRRIKGLTHEDCGYLAVALGLVTRPAQNAFADKRGGANEVVSNQLLLYGVAVAWAERDPHGSAAGYMEFMTRK
ncbi:hypothetical protein KBD75_01330 [Candidatus Woesebacteria bacterium]|nr:hypothetical protein [Candidatus Woesebacteria bacterium]